jgi:hypothetical protein
VAVLAVVLVAGGAALAGQWDRVAGRLDETSAPAVLLALVAVVAALGCSLQAWRALLRDLGSELALRDAARVFFLAQLGKYVPGSVWPAVAQVELAAQHAVPRRRSATATGALMVLTPVSGAVVGVVLLPWVSPDAARTYWPAAAVIPLGVLLLRPAVFNAVVDRLLRLIRRPPLEHPLSSRGLLGAAGWTSVAWLLYGLHVWALARDLDPAGGPSYARSVGAFALAWTVGFLVVVLPAGAGVRDVALAVVLAPGFGGTADERLGAAAGVALVSRLVMTVADLVCAAGGALAARRDGSARERGEHGDRAGHVVHDDAVDT